MIVIILQSMSTAMCLTANGNFSNDEAGLTVTTCAYDVTDLTSQNQVWTLTDDGLLMVCYNIPMIITYTVTS